MLGMGGIWGDTIIVDGKTYSGIKILQSDTRYYFRLPDGASKSVAKSDIKPGNIVFGDGPLKSEEPSAVSGQPEEKKAKEPTKPIEKPKPEKKRAEKPKKPVEESGQPSAISGQPEEKKPVEESGQPSAVSGQQEERKPVEAPKAMEPGKAAEMKPEETEFREEPPPLPKSAPLYAGAGILLVEDTPGLELNALVLRSGEATVAFCAVDAAAVDQGLIAAVSTRLAEKGAKIHPRNLLISATGVHTGLLTGCVQGAVHETLFGAFQQAAADAVAEEIAAVIAEAHGKLAPARVRVSEAEAPDFQALRSGGSATADSTVSILYVESQDAKPIACLINYAIMPVVLPGVEEIKGRGLPGVIASAINAAAGGEIPVLVINGAAGDIEPKPDFPGGMEALGTALAELAASAWQDVESQATVALNCWSQTMNLPPTLAPGLMPERAVLHEVRLDDTVFVSIPGLPAAQIGLLLRAKAMSAGAEHVFLLALTNGYTGFQPTIEEFFAATPPTCFAFYGPAMIIWYGDRCLRWANAEQPAWNDVPMLSQHASAYKNAVERGQQEKEALNAQWEKTRAAVMEIVKTLKADTLLPQEAQSVIKALKDQDRPRALLSFWPALLRRDAADFTEEQRVILMGIAEGARLPFDAVLLMQVLSKPNLLPQEIRGVLQKNEDAGFNLL